MRRIRYIEVKPGRQNVLAQVGAMIVGLVVLVVSVILGAFFLAAFFGLVLLVGITLYVRFWWLRQRIQKARREEFIETEYRVVDSTEPGDRGR